MNTPIFSTKTLWSPNEHYSNHRIPGMIVTNKGTLIAYCEARTSESDWAMMDIIMQRSTNRGETFAPPYVLAKGTEKMRTVNNPVMVQDKNGRIHFFYCENYTVSGGRALRRYSDDDGITWSDPIDITESTNPDYHNAFAFGPGHGVISLDGAVIIPVWMVPKEAGESVTSHTPSVISTLYSYDYENWQLGEMLMASEEIKSPNETSAAITSDGMIYLNVRIVGSCRAQAYSKDGHTNWINYSLNRQLQDPQCFGSVIAYDDHKHPYSILFAKCKSESSRTHVTVSVSTNDGQAYQISRLIDERRGGYAELAADAKNGIIYLLYEENFGHKDHLAIFNYEWLISNN